MASLVQFHITTSSPTPRESELSKYVELAKKAYFAVASLFNGDQIPLSIQVVFYYAAASDDPENIKATICQYEKSLSKKALEKVLGDAALFRLAFKHRNMAFLKLQAEKLPRQLYLSMLSDTPGLMDDILESGFEEFLDFYDDFLFEGAASAKDALKAFSHIWSFKYEACLPNARYGSEVWNTADASRFIIQSLASFDNTPIINKIKSVLQIQADLNAVVAANEPFLYVLPILLKSGVNLLHSVCLVLHLDAHNILHIIQSDRGVAECHLKAHRLEFAEKGQKTALLSFLQEFESDTSDAPKTIRDWILFGSKIRAMPDAGFNHYRQSVQKIGNCTIASLEGALLTLMAIALAEEKGRQVNDEEVVSEAKTLYKRWKRHSRKMAWENLQSEEYKSFLKENHIDLKRLKSRLDLKKHKVIRKPADLPAWMKTATIALSVVAVGAGLAIGLQP